MARTPALLPVGEWLSASFRRVGGRWPTLTALLLVGILVMLVALGLVYGLAVGLVLVVEGRDLFERIAQHPEFLGYLREDESLAGLLTLLNLVALLVALRVWSTFALALVHASADDRLGWRAALARAKGRSWAFIGMLVAQQVLVNLAMLLLIIPGIWLALRLWFCALVFAREDVGPLDAISRAFALSRGHAWGLLGRGLLLGLISGLIAIVPIVGWVVSLTLSMVAWAELYRQLAGEPRVRAG